MANTAVNLTVAGNTQTVNAADAPQKDGNYVFTTEVAAAQMTDQITLEVVTDGQQVYTGNYTVRDYAAQIYNGQYDKEVKNMVSAMLHYGAAAQTYFGYNLDNMANAGIGDAVAVEVPTGIQAPSAEGAVFGLQWYGASLVFQSRIAVRFYFKNVTKIENFTFTVDGTAYEPVAKNDMYYIEVGDINPYELDKNITVTVSANGEQMTATYSPMQYIINKYNGEGNEELKPLMQALCGYHQEASDYKVWEAGVMQSHANGMSGNGMYFTMAANAAPYNSDWSLEYTQISTDAVKLIRDGETKDIGIVGRPLLVKHGETDYFLKLEKWTIGEYGVDGGTTAITTDDVIIVEGNFVYDDVTLKVTKSYVYYDGSAWVCSAEAPAQKNVVDAVELGSHGNGWTTGGFYFTAAANDAPFDGWSLRYKPVSADVIKVVKADGTTTNVGNTGGETIVKYSDTEYYVEGWAVGSANMAAGNTFVIEGLFYNEANNVYIDVEKTYITLNEDGSTTVISETGKYIQAGAMSAYTSNWFGDGIYFALNSNAAPAAEDWTVRYMPKNAANIKLVRGGETVNIANTGAESVVKIADGQYWLSLESWWWNAYAPIQDGDVLIIEGEFANASNGYTLNISKTYITFVSKAEDNVVFSTAADTEFGDVLLPNTTDTLTIGMWNGSYHVFADKQLKELQAAGITKIMGINPIYTGYGDDVTDAEMTEWLDRVYSYGISVIIDLRGWDGTTVPGYVNHPGLIGFLMYDEPCATDFDTLADLKAKFDAVMPADKLFYVNLFPSCAAGTSLVGTIDWTLGRRDYNTYYVQKFLDKIGAEVLSWDNYSLLKGSGIRTDYFYNFEVMASKNMPLWYTMLSAGHGTTSTSYATPTADELRWQMAVALTYGVHNIDHYVYTSHESGYSCMVEYDTWEPTDLYYDIKDVDNEYLAWDNIYMAYDWVGVGIHSGNDSDAMLEKLNNELTLSGYGINDVQSSENLLIGVFDYDGSKAYMVTNAGSAGTTTVGDGKNFSMADTTATLTLADGDYKCVAIIDNGEISYVAVNNNTVTLNVEAYEGVFVIPVLN